MTRIGIIGGGPGGLMTAYLLKEFCADLCEAALFEAGPRLGGKVLTEQFTKAPVTYEAGVAELYSYAHLGVDPLRQLIKKFGLSTVPMTGPTVILGDDILRNDRDIKRLCGKKTLEALDAFHLTCGEMCSPENYYEGHWQDENEHPWADKTFRQVLDEIPDETARKYLEVAVRSDVATEPHLTSALNGLKNVLMDDPRYLRLYSIVGGNERLIDGLAKRIGAEVHLESPAVRVAKEGNGYRITTRRAGRFEEHDFDLVVLALPNYWLERLEWGNRELRLAMQKHLAHYQNPAHYLRMTILFQEPFWRKLVPGSYFMTDAFGGCCVYDEGARHPCEPYGVLGWLLAGNDALALSNYDDQQLLDMALDSLPAPLAHGKELFMEGRVKRWVGTISGLPGGNPAQETRVRHLPEPHEHDGLYVVGDYLFDSTLNGTFDSADFVTDMILTRLRKAKYMRPAAAVGSNGKLEGVNGHVNGAVAPTFHENYYSDVPYEEAFLDVFNVEWTIKLFEAVWGKKPPYRVLDCGSASGLTIPEFARVGVEAWGIENSKHIHSRTPAKLRKRNILGDVRHLPFPDNHFDVVYDTCLPFVPTEDLDQAVRELLRVTRVGVFFGGVSSDMTREVIEDYNLFEGIRSLFTLWEWSEIFLRNGFKMAINDPATVKHVWQIESEVDKDDWYWYHDPESMRYCFFSNPHRPAAEPTPRKRRVKARAK